MAPAGQPSEGRVLMRAVDYRALESLQDDENPAFLTFGVSSGAAEEPDQRRIFEVKALGCVPFITSSNLNVDYEADHADAVEVHLVHLDWWTERNTVVEVNYNVMMGFGMIGDVPTFKLDLSNEVYNADWWTIPSLLGYSFGQLGNEPPMAIRNLYSLGKSKAETVRMLSAGLGLIFDCENTEIWNRGQADPVNMNLAANYSNRVIEKAFTDVSSHRFPEKVQIGFTCAGFARPSQIKYYERSTLRGSSSIDRHVQVGHWYAIQKANGTIRNDTELGEIADWFSTGKGNVLDIHDDYGSYRFAGILNFSVDGYFRRVLWVCNANEVSTTVAVNHATPFRAREDDVADWFAAHPTRVSKSIDGTTLSMPSVEMFEAVITGSAQLAPNRWKYAWQKASLNGNVWAKQIPPDEAGTTELHYALNMNESPNTATYMGPGVLKGTGTDYPPAWSMIPIGKDQNAVQYDYPVIMYRSMDRDGQLRYWFHVENAHDGPCPP